MTAEPKHIKVTPGTELAEILEAANEGPVVFESNGDRYRLDRLGGDKEDIWADFDPEELRRAIRKYAGSIKDVDPDKWIADVYHARADGSRPPNRP